MVNWINEQISNLTEMLKEAGIYSVNRVVPVGLICLSTIVWLVVTIWLLASGDGLKSWNHYDQLCTVFLTLVGICATWLTGNKWTNSKYNTNAGAPGKPLAPTEYKPMMPLAPTLPSKEVTDTAKKIADGLDKVASKL
jgi:hypothetical protein|nr:MAG TPA: hypothetical protein [Caudoviricetes sp.]